MEDSGPPTSVARFSTGPAEGGRVRASRDVTGALRFLWDDGVGVPLWDERGLLPEDAGWLRGTLGLSEALVRDLGSWCDAMDALDGVFSPDVAERYAVLDAEALALVERVRAELPGLSIEHVPR